uniref:Uncharacterized protein n=1 Tax=Zea mays TaxID=4577 RepID=A0A804PRS5_MAIZE
MHQHHASRSRSPCPSSSAAARPRTEDFPVDIVSDEEMALIDAALAAAAAGARPLLSAAARRAAVPLSRAACSATDGLAAGDIEDAPPRSRLARFRERRALAVTDITATEWCEKQMEFVLERGKPEKTAAMRVGSDRHAQLEQEVVERVDVAIRSAEELWAVKFMNFIVGTNQLLFEGITREIPVSLQDRGCGRFMDIRNHRRNPNGHGWRFIATHAGGYKDTVHTNSSIRSTKKKWKMMSRGILAHWGSMQRPLKMY